MKVDHCLPSGPAPTPEQLAMIARSRVEVHKEHEIHLCLDGSAWFRKVDTTAMHAAKSPTEARQRINAMEKAAPRNAGPSPYDGYTYRLGRERTESAVSRKIVEDRDA